MANGIPRSTGLHLRLRRVAVGASQGQVAAAMGVSRRRVGNIEAMYRPPTTAIHRYLEALRRAAELQGIGGLPLSAVDTSPRYSRRVVEKRPLPPRPDPVTHRRRRVVVGDEVRCCAEYRLPCLHGDEAAPGTGM